MAALWRRGEEMAKEGDGEEGEVAARVSMIGRVAAGLL